MSRGSKLDQTYSKNLEKKMHWRLLLRYRSEQWRENAAADLEHQFAPVQFECSQWKPTPNRQSKNSSSKPPLIHCRSLYYHSEQPVENHRWSTPNQCSSGAPSGKLTSTTPSKTQSTCANNPVTTRKAPVENHRWPALPQCSSGATSGKRHRGQWKRHGSRATPMENSGETRPHHPHTHTHTHTLHWCRSSAASRKRYQIFIVTSSVIFILDLFLLLLLLLSAYLRMAMSPSPSGLSFLRSIPFILTFLHIEHIHGIITEK